MLVKLTTLKRCDRDEPTETLTLGRVYEVLAFEADQYRLLSDKNIPYLYPPEIFEVVDPSEPDFWVEEQFEEEEEEEEEKQRYTSPPEWQVRRFWEDLFDDDPTAYETFLSVLQRRYPWTWKERGIQALKKRYGPGGPGTSTLAAMG